MYETINIKIQKIKPFKLNKKELFAAKKEIQDFIKLLEKDLREIKE